MRPTVAHKKVNDNRRQREKKQTQIREERKQGECVYINNNANQQINITKFVDNSMRTAYGCGLRRKQGEIGFY